MGTNIEGYREVKVILTNGETFVTKSCYGRGDTIKLDVDPFNHPAWRKDSGNLVNVNNDRVTRFQNKHGSVFGE
ncbi:MAG: 50S ribosomal protein L31 [Rickettsiales bacterium]|jgi:ribosomal protein L31|nr:50S ribosomal protein L31 [Rickettsiales bacterium]